VVGMTYRNLSTSYLLIAGSEKEREG